jgi:hypothetical protein
MCEKGRVAVRHRYVSHWESFVYKAHRMSSFNSSMLNGSRRQCV